MSHWPFAGIADQDWAALNVKSDLGSTLHDKDIYSPTHKFNEAKFERLLYDGSSDF